MSCFILGKKIAIDCIYYSINIDKYAIYLVTLIAIDLVMFGIEKKKWTTPQKMFENDVFITILKICETVCNSTELENIVVKNGLDGYKDELAISIFSKGFRKYHKK